MSNTVLYAPFNLGYGQKTQENALSAGTEATLKRVQDGRINKDNRFLLIQFGFFEK